MAEAVLFERDRYIAKLTLNRTSFFNAFDFDMIDSFARTVNSLAADSSIRSIIVTGQGKAFCAGGDLKWVNDFPGGAPAAFHKLAASYHMAILELRRMYKPVIAAINGIAAGGGFALALACDFRIMAKSAVLRQAYTSNGLCIDGGGTFTLPRIVGMAKALEIVAFDAPVSSEQALNWGLVTRVVDDGVVLDEAVKMAEELSRISLDSFGQAKHLLNDSFNTGFESHIECERSALCRCAGGPDGSEGLKAFKEKRRPVYYVP